MVYMDREGDKVTALAWRCGGVGVVVMFCASYTLVSLRVVC